MRRSLVAASVAGLVALAGAVLIPGTARAAANLTCQVGFPSGAKGTYNNVIVPSTAKGSNFCFLDGATVLGNVSVQPGGAVFIANSTIAGTLTSTSAGTGTGGGGATFSVVMCGTTLGGNMSISGSSSPVEIFTDDYNSCIGGSAGNTLNGANNIVVDNRGGVEVESNQVNGNLSVSDNRGLIHAPNPDSDEVANQTTAVNNNSDSTHRLSCWNNAGVVVSSVNTFQSVVGQCHL